MSKMFDIGSHYFEHESGTKFYEINIYQLPVSGESVIVRRWGKIDQRMGRGVVKVTPVMGRFAASTEVRAECKKRARRGYLQRDLLHGVGMSKIATQSDIVAHYERGGMVKAALDQVGAHLHLYEERLEKPSPPAEEQPVRASAHKEWATW